MKKIGILCFFVACYAATAFAQVTIQPVFASEQDSVLLTFNAAQGSAGLNNYTAGDVYIHTGVLTNLSTSAGDWRYVKAGWTTNLPACKMTRSTTNPNLYTVMIRTSVRNFYAMTNANEHALKIACVFRSADGSKEGKTAAGGDIFADLYAVGAVVQTAFQTPTADYGIHQVGETVPLVANASVNAALDMTYDGISLAQQPNATQIAYNLVATATGDHVVRFIATTTAGFSDTAYYHFSVPQGLVQNPTGAAINGATVQGGNVRFRLTAPNKNNVYLIGSFNNWQPSANYELKKSTDGSFFWLDVPLATGQKYTYQYYVDGQIKIADPLSEVILNQWDDPYIPAANYPNRPLYPAAKTTGNVTLLELDLPTYNWQVPTFAKPKKTDLVVYELLIRDFVTKQSFDAVRDSLDYLQRLGINCIELMPVSEFEGNLSWGYNTAMHGTLDKYYGTRTAFRNLIDACHQRGIAVVMDIALNHAFSQCPLAQLYWDAANSRPAANNPWLNPVAKHDFNVGYDFNHESAYTKDYTLQVCRRWLADYKIDGFRFDLSKGFTQINTLGNTGAWGNYDQSRINIWKYYADQLRLTDPNAFLILEHFADNSEETVLANYGFMPWGNGTHDWNEASMGYTIDVAYATSYKARGWQQPGLVTYMESHDEERLMYKNLQYGATNATTGYNVKDLATALKRQELVAALLFSVPGPKMIYEFGELGYDKSINLCANGTNNTNCRTDQKPLLWNYYTEANRNHLFQVYKTMLNLKTTEPAFESTNFTLNTGGFNKVIKITDPSMNVLTIGNCGVSSLSSAPVFQQTGKWYELFTQDSLDVTDVNMQLTLAAGEYRLYTSRRVIVATEGAAPQAGAYLLTLFPNPTADRTTIAYALPDRAAVTVAVYDILGKKVADLAQATQDAGEQYLAWDSSRTPAGTYFVRLTVDGKQETRKLIVAK